LTCQVIQAELEQSQMQSKQDMTGELSTIKTNARGLLKYNNPVCVNLYDENGKERSFQDRIYKTDSITPAITTNFRPYYLVKGNKIE